MLWYFGVDWKCLKIIADIQVKDLSCLLETESFDATSASFQIRRNDFIYVKQD